ncbi:MAG: hypothetical protein AB1758_07580, partial [Candidatus Eremiobacterota bacterium]
QQAAQIRQELDDLQDDLNSPDPAVATAAQSRANYLNGEVIRLQQEFIRQQEAAIQAFVDYVETHADADGRYKTGYEPLDVPREYDIDINTYLPASEHYRVSYWRVVPGRR